MIGQEELPNPVTPISPGEDSGQFVAPAHKSIAEQASQALGAPVGPHEIVPAADHPVLDSNYLEEASLPGPLQEIEGKAVALVKGDSDAPSRSFLAKLKDRLLKQHPGGTLKEAA